MPPLPRRTNGPFGSEHLSTLCVVAGLSVCLMVAWSTISSALFTNVGMLALERSALQNAPVAAVAVRWFERALIFAETPGVLRNLGMAELQMGSPGMAGGVLRDNLRLRADDPLALSLLVETALAQGDMASAVATLAYLASSGRGTEWIGFSSSAQATARMRAQYLDAQGWSNMAKGDVVHAELQFRAAERIDPTWGQALLHLGLVLETRGDWIQAEVAYREAIDRGHDTADVRVRLGDVLLRLSRPNDARAEFQQALIRDPNQGPWAYIQLSDIAVKAARLDEAELWLLDAARRFPETPWPLYYLARLNATRGNRDLALEEVAGALRVAPDEPLIRTLYEDLRQ